jgi:hypothetical protein
MKRPVARSGYLRPSGSEFCSQQLHPLACFPFDPFVGVKLGIETVNMLDVINADPDLDARAAGGACGQRPKFKGLIV